MRIVTLNQETKSRLLTSLLKRSPGSYGEYQQTVNHIVETIKEKGDYKGEGRCRTVPIYQRILRLRHHGGKHPGHGG